jgi:hypothetical protein
VEVSSTWRLLSYAIAAAVLVAVAIRVVAFFGFIEARRFPTYLTACVASESILGLAGKNSPVIQAE